MRDLQADLEICNKATQGPWMIDLPQKSIWSGTDPGIVVNRVALWNDVQFIAQAREGWPHAIERAINAEYEVERLQINMIDYISGATYMTRQIQDLRAQIQDLRAENAKLRKVADAARALAPNEMYQYTRHLYALKHTLDEYDKAKEEKND